MDGLDALKAIRENSELSAIPIVILTNRDLKLAVLKNNSLPYDSLYKKPIGIHGYVQVMKAIGEFFEQKRFTLAPR
jgi:CheY-like chemotaxis protein